MARTFSLYCSQSSRSAFIKTIIKANTTGARGNMKYTGIPLEDPLNCSNHNFNNSNRINDRAITYKHILLFKFISTPTTQHLFLLITEYIEKYSPVKKVFNQKPPRKLGGSFTFYCSLNLRRIIFCSTLATSLRV